MKRSTTKQKSRRRVSAPPVRAVKAVRTYLRGQVHAFRDGFRDGWHNTGQVADDFGLGLAHDFMIRLHRLVHGIVRFPRAIGRRLRGGTQKTAHGADRAKRGVGRVLASFAGLLHQLGRDTLAVLGWPFAAAGRLGRETERDVRLVVHRAGRLIAKLIAPVARPIRSKFASQAKEELGEGEISVTPDQHSHWELIALTVVGVIAITGLALAATGQLPSAGTVSVSLNPVRLIEKMSTFSPEQMVLLGTATLVFGLMTWFWVNMTRDAFSRDFPTNTEQTKWRVVTALLFVPGAIAYFRNVYNHWSIRRFLGYHFMTVVVVGIGLVVVTSTYGTLWYFNQKANAVAAANVYKQPNLELDAKTQEALAGRSQYGTPLAPSQAGGRVDPFAPVPGVSTGAAPRPSASPTPSPSPTPAP